MVKSCQQSVKLISVIESFGKLLFQRIRFKSEPIFGTLHDGTVLILFYCNTQYTAEAGFETGSKGKYAEISEAIEQAEKAELDRILDDIASGSKKRLIRIRNNESDIEMTYLRCRRIAIVLEYFRFRTPKQNAVLKRIATTLSK